MGWLVLQKIREAAEGLSNLRSDTIEGYVEAFAHLGIASGLSDEQQRKLASLVRHFYVEGGTVKWLDPHRQEWREWQRNPALFHLRSGRPEVWAERGH